jgi:hypothetical protein
MQTRDRFPVDAVRGGDCVTGRYEVGPGEVIVDLDTDLEALPAWGRLCLHEDTVRQMMHLLGWKLHDPKTVARVFKLRDQCLALRRENAALRNALAAVINDTSTVDTVPVIEDEEVPV